MGYPCLAATSEQPVSYTQTNYPMKKILPRVAAVSGALLFLLVIEACMTNGFTIKLGPIGWIAQTLAILLTVSLALWLTEE